jgi:hypothetical protein
LCHVHADRRLQFSLELFYEVEKAGLVDEFNRFALRKSPRFLRVAAAGNENCGVGTLVRHHSEKLTQWFDSDFPGLPMFALDDGCATVFAQSQINTAIRSAPAGFFDLVSFLPVDFGELFFKFPPTQRPNPLEVQFRAQKIALLPPKLSALPAGEEANDSERSAKDPPESFQLRHLHARIPKTGDHNESNGSQWNRCPRGNVAKNEFEGFVKNVEKSIVF